MRGQVFIPVKILLVVSFYSFLSFADQAQIQIPPSITQLQKQITKSLQKGAGASKAEMVLDLIRQKFLISSPGSPVWGLTSYPSAEEIKSSKPRIIVKAPLASTASSIAPRWELTQSYLDGSCTNLPFPSRCTASEKSNCSGFSEICSNSSIPFEVDSSGLSSLQLDTSSEQTQKGYVGILSLSQLSDSEKKSLFSQSQFEIPSSGLELVPVYFLSYVADESDPSLLKAVRVQVGDTLGEVPVPPPAPTCPVFSVTRNGTTAKCSVTMTSSGVTTGASLTTPSSISLTQSSPGSNTWLLTNLDCPLDSSTEFKASVTGPGGTQSCSTSTVPPIPPPVCTSFSVVRNSDTPKCTATVTASGNIHEYSLGNQNQTGNVFTNLDCPALSSTSFNAQIKGAGGQTVACPTQTIPPITCGGPNENCYDHSLARLWGEALLPGTSTAVSYLKSDPSCTQNCFMVWKEKNGSRIMNSTGLWALGWQMKLNSSGKGFSTTSFVYQTDSAVLAGRACPTNGTLPSVFLNDDNPSNKFATGRCLYYDKGNSSRRFWDEGFYTWADPNSGKGIDPAWFERNMQVCGARGMRLPTAFEGRIDPDKDGTGLSGYPTLKDGRPSFAKENGVPALPKNSFGVWRRSNGEFTQSATAAITDPTGLIVLRSEGGSAGNTGQDDTSDYYYVRCVLP